MKYQALAASWNHFSCLPPQLKYRLPSDFSPSFWSRWNAAENGVAVNVSASPLGSVAASVTTRLGPVIVWSGIAVSTGGAFVPPSESSAALALRMPPLTTRLLHVV